MSEPGGQVFQLQGEVGTERAAEVKCAVEEFIDQSAGSIDIRLDKLESHGSVEVGLMMGWIRYAHRQEKALVFSRLPARLVKIIEFSGLNECLPLEED